MTPEEAVRTRLLAVSAVTALVSTRIHQLVFPQSAVWPAIRVQLISEPLDDAVDGEATIVMARVQVDAVTEVASGGNPYADAVALGAAIHGNGLFTSPTGLHRWRGSIGSPAYEVKGILRIDRDVQYESDEERLIRVRQDYQVWTKPE